MTLLALQVFRCSLRGDLIPGPDWLYFRPSFRTCSFLPLLEEPRCEAVSEVENDILLARSASLNEVALATQFPG